MLSENHDHEEHETTKKLLNASGGRSSSTSSSEEGSVANKSTIARGTPFPTSIYRILFSELCERFAYYGLLGILGLFFDEKLGKGENGANAYVNYFVFASYFAPLIGSYISDSYWGKYAVIIRFSLVYSLGAAVLTLAASILPKSGPDDSFAVTWVGLAFIALGTGGIKPCVSSFGADQLKDMPDRAERMTTYFSVFYFSINLGSIAAFLVIPEISDRAGYEFAFGTCSVVLFTSVIVIWSGRKRYLHAPVEGSIFYVIYVVIRDARRNKRLQLGASFAPASLEDTHRGGGTDSVQDDVSLRTAENLSSPVGSESGYAPPGLTDTPQEDPQEEGRASPAPKASTTSDVTRELAYGADTERNHWLDWAVPNHGRTRVEDIKAVFRVLPVFLLLPIFWALFNQQQTTWLFQARDMDRNFFGYTIKEAQFQIVNPLAIMILLPIFAKGVWPGLARCGIYIKLLDRMAVGFVIASASFAMSAWVNNTINNQGRHNVHITLQIPQIVIISISEILISVTGLEFAYSQAPETMKSVITALYLLTNAVGSLINGAVFSGLEDDDDDDSDFDVSGRTNILLVFAGAMLASLLPFLIIRSCYVYVPGTDGTAGKEAAKLSDGSSDEDDLEKPVPLLASEASGGTTPLLADAQDNSTGTSSYTGTRPPSTGSVNNSA